MRDNGYSFLKFSGLAVWSDKFWALSSLIALYNWSSTNNFKPLTKSGFLCLDTSYAILSKILFIVANLVSAET